MPPAPAGGLWFPPGGARYGPSPWAASASWCPELPHLPDYRLPTAACRFISFNHLFCGGFRSVRCEFYLLMRLKGEVVSQNHADCQEDAWLLMDKTPN